MTEKPTKHNSRDFDVEAPTVPGVVPSALAASQQRAATSRRNAQRVLARQRLRRRVVPPLIVGSTVLLGGGLSAAWVNGTLQGTGSQAPASAASAGGAAETAELQAIEHVREAIVIDSQTIASLSKAARRALIASQKTTVVNEGGSGSGTGPGAPAPTAGSGGTSLGSVPSLPALPPMPSINIPTTQGTTGASHVIP